MRGLIGAQQPGGQPAANEQQPVEQPDDGQTSEEEQEAFTRVEVAAMELLHGEGADEIVKQLQAGAQSPGETLGRVAMLIFSQIDEQSGGRLPEEVMLQGALKVLDLTAELAESSGAMQVDDQVRKQAVQFMLIEASELGYISEADIPELEKLISGMDQNELQNTVADQQQAAGMAMNG